MDFMCHLTRNDDATSPFFPYLHSFIHSLSISVSLSSSVLDSFILDVEIEGKTLLSSFSKLQRIEEFSIVIIIVDIQAGPARPGAPQFNVVNYDL